MEPTSFPDSCSFGISASTGTRVSWLPVVGVWDSKLHASCRKYNHFPHTFLCCSSSNNFQHCALITAVHWRYVTQGAAAERLSLPGSFQNHRSSHLIRYGSAVWIHRMRPAL